MGSAGPASATGRFSRIISIPKIHPGAKKMEYLKASADKAESSEVFKLKLGVKHWFCPAEWLKALLFTWKCRFSVPPEEFSLPEGEGGAAGAEIWVFPEQV